MMETKEKITREEIESLKQAAIAEKEELTAIKVYVNGIKSFKKPENKEEMELKIASRGKESELKLLLESYVEYNDRIKLFSPGSVLQPCEKMQMLMLENVKNLSQSWTLLIQHFHLTSCVELYLISNKAQLYQPLSSENMQLMLENVFNNIPKNSDSYYKAKDWEENVRILRNYGWQYRDAQEVYFLQELLKLEGRNEISDALSILNGIWRIYISRFKVLCLEAEKVLLESADDHDRVMYYLQYLDRPIKAEEQLFERADREEIETYFERYPHLR